MNGAASYLLTWSSGAGLSRVCLVTNLCVRNAIFFGLVLVLVTRMSRGKTISLLSFGSACDQDIIARPAGAPSSPTQLLPIPPYQPLLFNPIPIFLGNTNGPLSFLLQNSATTPATFAG